MRFAKRLVILGLSALLLGCGGGGGDSGSSLYGSGSTTDGGSGSTTTVIASAVEVLASSNSVSTAGDQVTITAVVKTSGNVGISNAVVNFSATTGVLRNVSAVTDANGVATAKFDTGSDKSNRQAVIQVTSGAASGSIAVPISGSKITIAGPTTVKLGETALLTLKAVDSNGNPISNVQVGLASSLGNGLSRSAGSTDSSGQLSVSYTATKSGADTISYSGVGAIGALALIVSGEDFVFTTPAAAVRVPVGTDQPLQVRYRVNGVAISGKLINFTATNGTLTPSSATTDSNGLATVNIKSGAAAPATVLAQISGESIQASLPLNFVATTPARLVLQVTPAAIGPNISGVTTNQAQVVAKVFDDNSNPVPGVTVNFQRTADPSGGNFLQPSAVTDINGQAAVQYVAGPQSTASNGVALHAEVAGNTGVAGNTSMTVNQSALFIALGTGNVITNVDPQTYKKDWVVYVTDANGVAVSNVTLTIKVLPQLYGKGTLVYSGASWVRASNAIDCPNEDINFNGVIDPLEDGNGNGILEPGNVISVTPGTLTTDSTGRATLSLIYAESYVPWVTVALQVRALVSGTESVVTSTFIVSGLASDFTNKDITPAGVISPFGTHLSCSIPN